MARKNRRLVLAIVAAAVAGLAAACGPSYTEIPIETPIQPKLDVSAFQRVLVAGFVAGGTDDVDANLETVRLLRSQLRTKSSLKVIDADVMPLLDIAQDQSKPAEETPSPAAQGSQSGPAEEHQGRKGSRTLRAALRQHVLLEDDRRGIPESADRDRHSPVRPQNDVGAGQPRRGGVR
jgi:hypothetical protein